MQSEGVKDATLQEKRKLPERAEQDHRRVVIEGINLCSLLSSFRTDRCLGHGQIPFHPNLVVVLRGKRRRTLTEFQKPLRRDGNEFARSFHVKSGVGFQRMVKPCRDARRRIGDIPQLRFIH